MAHPSGQGRTGKVKIVIKPSAKCGRLLLRSDEAYDLADGGLGVVAHVYFHVAHLAVAVLKIERHDAPRLVVEVDVPRDDALDGVRPVSPRKDEHRALTVEIFEGDRPADVDGDDGDVPPLDDGLDVPFRSAEVVAAVNRRLDVAARLHLAEELRLADEAVGPVLFVLPARAGGRSERFFEAFELREAVRDLRLGGTRGPDEAQNSAAAQPREGLGKGTAHHFAEVQKVVVAIDGQQPRKVRIPRLAEEHGIGRARARNVVGAVVEHDIEGDNVLPRAHDDVLRGDIGEIFDEAFGPRAHAAGGDGRDEEHVGDLGELSDELLRARGDGLCADELGVGIELYALVGMSVSPSPALDVLHAQRLLVGMAAVDDGNGIGIAFVERVVDVETDADPVLLHNDLTLSLL